MIPGQTQQLRDTVRGYGGSDRTTPSFNRTQYVRFGSSRNARDLGCLPDGSVMVESVIGGVDGTQTQFFTFCTSAPARVGVRQVPLNPYTDQYVSIALTDPNGANIPLGAPGGTSELTLSITQVQVQEPILLEGGYVVEGYWDTDYAEEDGVIIPLPPEVETELGFIDDTAAFISTLRTLSPVGVYRVTVSSSQWLSLPFKFQIVARVSSSLEGEATVNLEGQGRLSLLDIAGTADVALEPSGYILKERRLGSTDGSEAATLSLSPTASIRRLSPLQGAILGF